MNLRKIVLPIAGAAIVFGAWRAYGWQGVAFAVSVLVLWVLLHFTRLMAVLKRAADRPVGWVASAVMLNAKLRPGVNLLHVVALTRSLGQQLSPKDQQPEVFRWTDNGGSHVTCEFTGGKLASWSLYRPPAEAGDVPADAR
ncbi:hypothetical protein [Ramlibacter tataouinensis]|uniref:Candidate Glycerate kinase n=1 Tax=Ramlibacter tataouinensis (strain ATCC BAA-407 / DSM 14655 / LMG 21543 / TTB310) TaxID=365046 RepID=F5Y3X2_RAMTT|nr:hypothetical protein [Ramlibacter tataouinensis]AEG91250.1 Candidate Glycerate kinase [Ramlibacter tataouinensis TTB310]